MMVGTGGMMGGFGMMWAGGLNWLIALILSVTALIKSPRS
jgi:hypothetical protein